MHRIAGVAHVSQNERLIKFPVASVVGYSFLLLSPVSYGDNATLKDDNVLESNFDCYLPGFPYLNSTYPLAK